MKFTLSLKKTWHSLILLLATIPALLIFIWSSTIYYQLLLEKNLLEVSTFGELAVDHTKQEIDRLRTLLENKSDPMSYTLKRGRDYQLIDELLYKVLRRESTVHALLIIGPDGRIITGMETYDKKLTPLNQRSGLAMHLQHVVKSIPNEIKRSLQSKSYLGPVTLHQEGVFFILSVPIGSAEQPQGTLVAHIDASSLWKNIQSGLHRKMFISYLVDSKGFLLNKPAAAHNAIGDSMQHFSLVKSHIAGQNWKYDQAYKGLMGHQVYGNYVQVNDIGLGIVTEVDKEYILEPIRSLFLKLIIVAVTAIAILLWLGEFILSRVIKPIEAISSGFKRVGKHDYRPSAITSSFVELQTLVEGFNHMVNKIQHNYQELERAAVVFDNTSEGIVITDTEHRVVSINRAFSDITGYCEKEIIGNNLSILKSNRHDKEFYIAMWNSIIKKGKWRGEICNRRKNGEIYTELLSINTFRDTHGDLTYHIGVFTDISYIKDTEDKLEYLAHHDQLTNLPNRLLCHARMDHELEFAKRNSEQVAILFLDLDMFKNINDSMGHAKGDLILQQVAKRIKASLRNKDTIARLGGDEFIIVVGSLKSREDAATVSKNTLKLFSAPFLLDEKEVFIGVSIGISIYPDDGGNNDVLLRNADAAMYHAKSKGRNNYQFYKPALTEKAHERLNLENHLRQAMTKNELLVYYQPQYSIKDKKIIGVEALLRWNHSKMGMVSPKKFIHIAEETGLIIPVGKWVLETACRQLKEWMNAGGPSIRMAVNLSARQFMEPGLEKTVKKIIEDSGINPENLELELTESIIMHDTDIVSDTLNALHHMGVGLSIDDFGTGYSSLSYIRRFPLDRLKIDRSFVKDIMTNKNDAEMIVSIIALAHSMELQVIAEGVETKEQLVYLQEELCDEVQGYYFSHPVPADVLGELINIG